MNTDFIAAKMFSPWGEIMQFFFAELAPTNDGNLLGSSLKKKEVHKFIRLICRVSIKTTCSKDILYLLCSHGKRIKLYLK